jgi:hypothetical protein
MHPLSFSGSRIWAMMASAFVLLACLGCATNPFANETAGREREEERVAAIKKLVEFVRMKDAKNVGQKTRTEMEKWMGQFNADERSGLRLLRPEPKTGRLFLL